MTYANDLHKYRPVVHRERSNPLNDNEKTASWVLGTLTAVLEQSDLTAEGLQVLVDEAIRRRTSSDNIVGVEDGT